MMEPHNHLMRGLRQATTSIERKTQVFSHPLRVPGVRVGVTVKIMAPCPLGPLPFVIPLPWGGGGLPFSTLRHKHRYKPIPLASLCRAEGHWNFLEFLLFAITGAIQRNSLRRHKNYKNGLVYAEQGSDQNM